MSEWREVLLGDVITLQRGFDLTEKDAAPGSFPVISSGGASYTTNVPKVEGPGVLTGRKGVLGKVHYSSSAFWPHDTTLWVKDFKGSVPRFVFYLLQTLPLAMLDAGASNPTLNRNHAHLLPVRVPTPPIQARIASVLGAMDELIENNRRRVGVLEEMARAIYREWFVRFRYPGHENVPLVDSALGPIPYGWEVAELRSVADVNRRSRTPANDEVIRYLDISAVGERTVEALAQVDGDQAPGRARRVVEAGDVVWSMVRPNRRAHALLVAPGPDWIASTGLAVLSAKSVSSTWLFETLSTKSFSDYLVSQEGGAAYPAVKPKDFEGAPILVPPRQIDGLFADRVNSMHSSSWFLHEQSQALAALRDLLLPKLVTGQIDVSYLDLDALTEAPTA